MSKAKNILDYFPEYYFWDTDAKCLDMDQHAPYIIEKVLKSNSTERTFQKDIEILERLYPKTLIQEVVEDSANLRYESDIQLWINQRYIL